MPKYIKFDRERGHYNFAELPPLPTVATITGFAATENNTYTKTEVHTSAGTLRVPYDFNQFSALFNAMAEGDTLDIRDQFLADIQKRLNQLQPIVSFRQEYETSIGQNKNKLQPI